MPARPVNEWVASAMDGDAIGLENKVIVVTGATQGLGEAVPAAGRGARGAAGIAVVGRDKAKGETAVAGLRDLGTDALFVAVELAEPDVAERVMSVVDEHFGVVHGVVNAAALDEAWLARMLRRTTSTA